MIWRVASMPSITGMRMSMSTMSGCSRSTASTAAAPLPATPTTVSPARVSARRNWSCVMPSSSQITTRLPASETLAPGASWLFGERSFGEDDFDSSPGETAIRVRAVRVGKEESALQIVGDESLDQLESDVRMSQRVEAGREAGAFILNREKDLRLLPVKKDLDRPIAVTVIPFGGLTMLDGVADKLVDHQGHRCGGFGRQPDRLRAQQQRLLGIRQAQTGGQQRDQPREDLRCIDVADRLIAREQIVDQRDGLDLAQSIVNGGRRKDIAMLGGLDLQQAGHHLQAVFDAVMHFLDRRGQLLAALVLGLKEARVLKGQQGALGYRLDQGHLLFRPGARSFGGHVEAADQFSFALQRDDHIGADFQGRVGSGIVRFRAPVCGNVLDDERVAAFAFRDDLRAEGGQRIASGHALHVVKIVSMDDGEGAVP